MDIICMYMWITLDWEFSFNLNCKKSVSSHMKLHLHWPTLFTVYISRKMLLSCIFYTGYQYFTRAFKAMTTRSTWPNYFPLLWQCCKNVCAILTRPAAQKPDNAAQCLSHVGKTMGGVHCLDASTGVPQDSKLHDHGPMTHCLWWEPGKNNKELQHFIKLQIEKSCVSAYSNS